MEKTITTAHRKKVGSHHSGGLESTLDVAAVLLLVLGPIFVFMWRYLRRQLAEYAERNRLHEERIDPNRSSSGLGPKGDPNPEDEI